RLDLPDDGHAGGAVGVEPAVDQHQVEALPTKTIERLVWFIPAHNLGAEVALQGVRDAAVVGKTLAEAQNPFGGHPASPPSGSVLLPSTHSGYITRGPVVLSAAAPWDGRPHLRL